ncbi:hypothetical protein KKF55_00605 [Patescibacteria group bacterium]|nr:hypothetical protein [Patescibacteria group bacterium]
MRIDMRPENPLDGKGLTDAQEEHACRSFNEGNPDIVTTLEEAIADLKDPTVTRVNLVLTGPIDEAIIRRLESVRDDLTVVAFYRCRDINAEPEERACTYEVKSSTLAA